MKYIRQLLIILAFSALGELLQSVIPLPVPAAIYGMLLLLAALGTGLLKPANISDTARFLIQIMPLLFVPPAVQLLAHWGVIAPQVVPICAITVLSTLVVFAVSGLVTKWFRKRGGGCND